MPVKSRIRRIAARTHSEIAFRIGAKLAIRARIAIISGMEFGVTQISPASGAIYVAGFLVSTQKKPMPAFAILKAC
jgi:hypothetical protein